MMTLKWEEHYDCDDNTFWVANVDVDGYQYSYRIRQKLKSNKKVYVEDSDFYARIDIRNPYKEHWTYLEDAQTEMWRHFLSTFDEKDD